jgi:hypothetical protein
MTDIAAISAALTSIKTATEIAKIISQAGSSIEKAESNTPLKLPRVDCGMIFLQRAAA